jgi:hypothetical protein
LVQFHQRFMQSFWHMQIPNWQKDTEDPLVKFHQRFMQSFWHMQIPKA